MKLVASILIASLLLVTTSAQAIAPTLSLEEKIAYQQGQFGALYARCGSADEKAVIGGSLSNWRVETFRGYQGSPQDRADIENAFDKAAAVIDSNPAVCKDWVKQAGVTWHSIVQLVRYGGPIVLAH